VTHREWTWARRRAGLGAALLVGTLFARSAAAQTATAPAAAPTDPQPNPGRPTVSTPATLTPVGYLQFENGLLVAHHSGEFSSQLSVNQVTKLAVHERLQIIVNWEPFARTRADGQATTSPGGLSAGVQAVLVPGGDSRPTVAVGYSHAIADGSTADIDIGSARQTAIFLVSDDVGGFHVDVNELVNDQHGDQARRTQHGETLSVSHPIGKITLTAELWRFSQPLLGGACAGSLWAISFPVGKTTVVDAGFNRGLTSTSTRWEAFAGFTVLLPKRVW
jgi:hypothetical protein